MSRTGILLSAGLLLTSVSAFADDIKQVEHWLLRMHSAAHTLNYTGSFVYQQAKQLTAMQIVHAVDAENGERERLVSQDALGREVIRDRERVRVYLPDIRSVVIEKDREESDFPPEFPVILEDLKDSYTFLMGKQERVAGRPSQQVVIKPKDKFRYGHRLWIDTRTGLLLKKQTFDERYRLRELFMFTEIQFRESIPEELLEPGVASSDFKLIEADADDEDVQTSGGWTARKLPPGFEEDTQRHHRMPRSKVMVDHLVYTDGLVSVSVFIEPASSNTRKLLGASHLGVVNAYGRSTEKFHIVAVGEVPQATVKFINDAVYFQEAARHD